MSDENLIELTVRPSHVSNGQKIYISGKGLVAVSRIKVRDKSFTASAEGNEMVATVAGVEPGGVTVWALDPSGTELGKGVVIVDR